MRLQNATIRVSKNTGMLFMGTVCKMVFSFAFVIYVARHLGVEGFGKLALTQYYFDLFLSMSATGLTILITREIAKKPSWLNQYLTASVVLVTVLTLVAGGIMITISRVFGYASDTQSAIFIASLALLPASVGLVFEAVFLAFEKAEYITYGTVIESICRVGLGIFVLFMGYGLLALFVVLIITRLCMVLFYFAFLRWRIVKLRWHFDWISFKQLIRNWRVFALENWLSNINGSFGVIVLSIIHGELAVGVYAATMKILRLGSIVAASYTQAIFPHMSRLFVETKDMIRQINEYSLKYMLVFILPVIVTMSIFADQIVMFLYTDEYADSIPIFRVLVWGLLLKFYNPFLSHILFARGEQKKSFQVAIIKFFFLVAIGLWVIPLWGGIGTAWTVLLASCVSFCSYFVFVMHGEEKMHILLTLGRAALAAISLGVFFLVLRNIALLPLLISGGVLYIFMLFVLRVLSSNDLELLQRLR